MHARRAQAARGRRARAAWRRPGLRRASSSRVSTLPRKSTTRRSGRMPLHLRLAPQRRGADHRAGRKLVKRRRLGADEGVAHIGARQDRGDAQPAGKIGRQGPSSSAPPCRHRLEQRLVDLLGEQALAAELAQRLVLDAVAGGGDRAQARSSPSPRPLRLKQARPDMPRLPKRKRAAAGADQEGAGGHG